MLAYAAQNPRPAGRAGSPKALTFVILGHAVLLAAVLTAKSELVIRDDFPIPDVFNVPIDPPKPEPKVDPQPKAEPKPSDEIVQDRVIDEVKPIVDMGQVNLSELDKGPIIRDLPTLGGGGGAIVADPPRNPVKLGPRFATNENAIKPPYPLDKRRAEEEATLKLKLTIDPRGRVAAVEPVGAADPSFLEAARRHIIRSWRYKPATEDGVAVSSSTVITLAFRLEDV